MDTGENDNQSVLIAPSLNSKLVKALPRCEKGLQDLPIICLNCIFENLSTNGLLACTQVCQRWRRMLHSSPQLWRRVILSTEEPKFVQSTSQLLPMAQYVQHLTIVKKPCSQQGDPWAKLLKLFLKKSNKGLLALEIIETGGTDGSSAPITDELIPVIARVNTNLRSLTFSLTYELGYFGDEMMLMLTSYCPYVAEFHDFMDDGLSVGALQQLSSWTHLRHLTVNSEFHEISPFLTVLHSAVGRQLRSLSITVFSEDLHSSWSIFVRELGKFDKLKELQLDLERCWEFASRITPQDVDHLLQKLPNLCKVTLAIYYHNYYEFDEIEHMADSKLPVVTGSQLKQLNITHLNSTDDVLKGTVQRLTNIKNYPNKLVTLATGFNQVAERYPNRDFRLTFQCS